MGRKFDFDRYCYNLASHFLGLFCFCFLFFSHGHLSNFFRVFQLKTANLVMWTMNSMQLLSSFLLPLQTFCWIHIALSNCAHGRNRKRPILSPSRFMSGSREETHVFCSKKYQGGGGGGGQIYPNTAACFLPLEQLFLAQEMGPRPQPIVLFSLTPTPSQQQQGIQVKLFGWYDRNFQDQTWSQEVTFLSPLVKKKSRNNSSAISR